MPKVRRSKDEFTPRHADVGNVEKTEPRFDQIHQIEAYDRQMHVQKSLEAGLTREQAEKHADDDHASWSPRDIEEQDRA